MKEGIFYSEGEGGGYPKPSDGIFFKLKEVTLFKFKSNL